MGNKDLKIKMLFFEAVGRYIDFNIKMYVMAMIHVKIEIEK